MELKSFETLVRTENTARLFLANTVGKKVAVFAPVVGVEKSTESPENGFVASNAPTRFTILPDGGDC
jgi:hypothetical protein